MIDAVNTKMGGLVLSKPAS